MTAVRARWQAESCDEMNEARARWNTDYPTCYLCGELLDWSNQATICGDHIIATVHGGCTNPENVRPVHVRCNLTKGAKLVLVQPLTSA